MEIVLFSLNGFRPSSELLDYKGYIFGKLMFKDFVTSLVCLSRWLLCGCRQNADKSEFN